MIDARILRERPQTVREAIRKKKFPCDLDSILDLDRRRRRAVWEAESLRAEQKGANSEMASLEKGSAEFLRKVERLRELANTVKARQTELHEIERNWSEALLSIPNIPHGSVPEGGDAQDNAIVRTWGDPRAVSGASVPHYDIPAIGRYIDLRAGTKVTGSGFPFFIGGMAKLVRSLIEFFLDEAGKAGYGEVMTPLLVNEASARATGHLPDKERQMYELANERFFLIPTAEVPITSYFRGEILELSELPVAWCGYTPCFRREAGSYGKDVRGLNRTHQFDKVELVRWVHPEGSYEELEGMLRHVEGLLRKLEIPYRILLMCAGEIGFPHAKQYDFEVWASGQKRWLEVSSCSNFTDFQARRANIRYRDESGRLRFVHTLNGSALAIPRVLAALIENNLQEGNRVRLPRAVAGIFGDEVLAL